MRRNDPHSLGIELNEREIRIVLANVRGGKATVEKALAFPLMHGTVMNGVVLEPGTLNLALRRAIDSLGVAPSAASLAIASEQSHFRIVTVPPCPESELPALVASEIEHQGALNLADPFGFFPIRPHGPEGEAMQTLAVVGVDAQLAQSLVETLEAAGLAVSALEPAPLAMLRVATAGIPSGMAAFALVVGRGTTEAAYYVNGQLAAFRRLDIGSDHLIQAFQPYDEEGMPIPGWTGVDADATDRLALEAQRTMDYVQRADRSAAVDRVRLVCGEPGCEPLVSMLEHRFGLPVEIVAPRAPEGEEPDVRFTAAYGLATRALTGGVASPAVDLFTAGRIEARRVETKRYFVGSLLVASLSVAVGLIGCLMYNGQIAAAQRRVAGIKSQTEASKKATADALDAQAAEAARDRALRKEGAPMGAVIDDVASSLDPNVGVKLVTVGDDLTVHIEGEARDEAALVRTAEALKSSRVLRNIAVDRFDRDDKNADPKATGGLKFEISGATVAADRVAKKAKA